MHSKRRILNLEIFLSLFHYLFRIVIRQKKQTKRSIPSLCKDMKTLFIKIIRYYRGTCLEYSSLFVFVFFTPLTPSYVYFVD